MGRREDLESLARAWNAAWNSRDPSQLVAFFTPDGTYYEPDFTGGPVGGAAGISEVAQKVAEFLRECGEQVCTIAAQEHPGIDIVGDLMEDPVLEQADIANARVAILALSSCSRRCCGSAKDHWKSIGFFRAWAHPPPPPPSHPGALP